MGNVDMSGRLSRGSPQWPLWGLDIKNACPRADGFDREVYLRDPREWDSEDTCRAPKLRAPAYGLTDAPVAVHSSLCTYFVNSVESLPAAGLCFEVSSFSPRVYFIYRKWGRPLRSPPHISILFWGAANPI